MGAVMTSMWTAEADEEVSGGTEWRTQKHARKQALAFDTFVRSQHVSVLLHGALQVGDPQPKLRVVGEDGATQFEMAIGPEAVQFK